MGNLRWREPLLRLPTVGSSAEPCRADRYRDSGLGTATGCPVSRTGLQVQQPPAAAGGLDELLVPIPARTSPETQVDHNIATLPDHVHQAPAHDVLAVLRQARVPAGAVVDTVAPEPEPDLLVDGQALYPWASKPSA